MQERAPRGPILTAGVDIARDRFELTFGHRHPVADAIRAAAKTVSPEPGYRARALGHASKSGPTGFPTVGVVGKR